MTGDTCPYCGDDVERVEAEAERVVERAEAELDRWIERCYETDELKNAALEKLGQAEAERDTARELALHWRALAKSERQ